MSIPAGTPQLNALAESLAGANPPSLLEAAKQMVYLKDMKDRLRRLHEMGHGTDWDYYHKNKAPAWDALRAAIAAAQAERKCVGPTPAPGQCPTCGEYSMAARAMQGLYGHQEKQP